MNLEYWDSGNGDIRTIVTDGKRYISVMDVSNYLGYSNQTNFNKYVRDNNITRIVLKFSSGKARKLQLIPLSDMINILQRADYVVTNFVSVKTKLVGKIKKAFPEEFYSKSIAEEMQQLNQDIHEAEQLLLGYQMQQEILYATAT